MDEDDDYISSHSEDDNFSENELLLENSRNLMKRKGEISSDEEVYGFGESDTDGEGGEGEEEDEEEEGINMGSDLEDEEKLPDDRAWGKRKKNFYSTDFVDQDYEGIYQGVEAEVTELEEQEARNIQERLARQLNDVDFSITETVNIAETTESSANEVILSDLTNLTKRQKLDLIKKESPEFFVLVKDFKCKMEEAQKLLTVINFFKKKVEKSFFALNFLQTKLITTLNYCTNVSYYLFLKAKKIPIKNHPVLKNLFQYRQILEQLEPVDKKIIQPQLDKILKKINSGKEILIDENLLENKTILKVLLKQNKKKEKEEDVEKVEIEEHKMNINEDEEMVNSADKKRAITYEMARNKGLLPKRSKVQRNPRVKHRRKFEKAKIRRRGQVRTPRAEIPVYGGEPTGIKIGLTKSIKIKY